MGQHFMGQELSAVELRPGQAPPAKTPPEGVILVRPGADGWTRKYLYHANGLGRSKEILIAEIRPGAAAAGRAIPLSGPAPQVPAPAAPVPLPFSGQEKIAVRQSLGPLGMPIRSNSPFMGQGTARLAQTAPPPAPSGTAAPAPLPQPSGDVGLPAPAPGCSVCPGPMQLPDGKVVHLDDPITLSDLCQMLPKLVSQCAAPSGPAPASLAPGAVPVVGAPGQPIPGAGFPSFGPAAGGFGGGGFGGGGGSTPPGFGPVGVVSGQPTPLPVGPGQGPPGPPGPPGPAGSAQIDFLIKTDGDFVAGPGAFVPVPGTLLGFTQGSDGPVLFFIQATLGCGTITQNAAIGLRIDGIDVQIYKRIIQTNVGGVGEFLIDQPIAWPATLLAGPHTVELLIRGVPGAEGCGAFDFPAGVSANPDLPLALTVLHK
jgi:hypothetical protein